MAMLTDDDKKKTIAEYLGITGTPEEIQEKLEKDSSKLQAFIREEAYGLAMDSIHGDSKGLFPYVIRAILYQDKKDSENRLISDLSQLTPRTVGEFILNKEEIKNTLAEQAQQIKNDYEFQYGSKKELFLNATEYPKDGHEESYFYRFWRSPVSNLMKYRGIDTGTEAGIEHAKKILRGLYGPTADGKDISILLNTTPECLVEDKGRIEREDQRKKADKERIEAELKDKPLWETLKELHGVIFPNGSDSATMAAIAANNENAKGYIKSLMRLEERDKADLELFGTCIDMSPNQIIQGAEGLKKDLIARNDERYIVDHPHANFGEFLRERRSDLLGEDEKRNTLAFVIRKTASSLDGAAVRKALDTECTQLRAEADKIVNEAAKRKSRRWKIATAVSTLSAILVLWAGKAAFSSASRDDKPTKAPTVQRPMTPQKQAAKPVEKPQAKAPAQAVTSTNMVQKALDNATTNTVATAAKTSTTNGTKTATPATTNGLEIAQQPVKPTEIIGKKGNHLVALRWTGYKDMDYYREMPEAHDLVFKTHFDYMLKRIQNTGLPFGDLFKPEHTRQALKKVHNYVWLKPDGQKEIRFYIRTDGRTRDAILEDVLSFYMNCRDVLQSLPVSQEKLPMAQSMVMTALGPSMGFSTKQQLAWQQMHPEEAQQASSEITQLTQQLIQAGKVDTNNVEAVFMETIKATQAYRTAHPDNKALLLTVDEVARSIVNVGKENMEQYSSLEKLPEETEAHKHIEELHLREKVEELSKQQEQYAPYRAPSSRPGKSSDDSGGFPWKTTAAVGIIAYLWGRKKRKR